MQHLLAPKPRKTSRTLISRRLASKVCIRGWSIFRPQKSGFAAGKALAAQIALTIETHFILYQIGGCEVEFIKAVTDAVREGRSESDRVYRR
jgi:hypothetical protein